MPVPPPIVAEEAGFEVSVGVPLYPILPVFVIPPATDALALNVSVVPVPTLILPSIVFVPPAENVLVPVPVVAKLYKVTFPDAPPKALPEPVIVRVGEPELYVSVPVGVIFPGAERLTLRFRVELVPTARSLPRVNVEDAVVVEVVASPTVKL